MKAEGGAAAVQTREASPECADEAPIFIGGAPRSGTTLLRTMLDSHSRLAAGPELHLLPTLAARTKKARKRREFVRRLERYPWWRDIAVPRRLSGSDAQLRLAVELRDAYLRRVGKPRWVEKTPANVHHVDLLLRLFPQGLFIHCVRDGRDAVCSLLAADWYRPRLPWPFLRAVVTWVRAVEAGRKASRVLGPKYFEVRYEDLVRSPEPVLRDVLEFAGEPWEAGVLAYDRRPHDWSTLGQTIDRPVFETSIGRWRRELTPFEVRLFRRLAGPTLARLGYAWDEAEEPA
jgi:hypothetical protein